MELEARTVAEIMENMSVVKQFREMSVQVQKTHQGGQMFGPMGFKTDVNPDDFRSKFSIFLQEFEALLLMNPVVRTIERFPDSELLFSFHDGCVIAVKEEEKEEFFKELNKFVLETGKLLDLDFPQKMEIQNTYPTQNGLEGF